MSAGGITAGVYTTNAAEQCGYIVQNSGSRFYIAENEEQFDKTLKFRKDTPASGEGHRYRDGRVETLSGSNADEL